MLIWSPRIFRAFVAISGILGVAALGVYYSVPLPVPAPNAALRDIVNFGARFHDRIALDAWLQAIGSLLAAIFLLALVYLAKGLERLSGWIASFGIAMVLAMALLDVAITLGALQGAVNGHPATAVVCFDLTFVFVHVFPIVPAMATFLGLGALLLRSPVLPRLFSWVALVLGLGFGILGFAGPFNPRANGATIFLLSLQEIWIVAAAIVVLLQTEKRLTPVQDEYLEEPGNLA